MKYNNDNNALKTADIVAHTITQPHHTRRTSVEVYDSSTFLVSVRQHSYSTRVIDTFNSAGYQVTNHVLICFSNGVVVYQQFVRSVVIKFTGTQKSQQKRVVSTRLQACKQNIQQMRQATFVSAHSDLCTYVS